MGAATVKSSWTGWGREKLKDLGELDFGHVTAVLITVTGFLLFLLSAAQIGTF
jgi:hypothetical protein